MTQLRLLEGLLNDGSVWRMRALAERGIAAATVRRAVVSGLLEQVSRGTYRAAACRRNMDDDFAELVARVSDGVVCLQSAAFLHGLGDVAPTEIWLALPVWKRRPRVEWPPAKFISWSAGARFEVGIETRVFAGVAVNVTGPARTVVDMLGHASTVGEDRAHQCLNDYLARGGLAADLAVVAGATGYPKAVREYFQGLAVLGAPR